MLPSKAVYCAFPLNNYFMNDVERASMSQISVKENINVILAL